ncbi:hypothetical protein Sango_2179100 [Sesamum angolense]|uniref:Uncharacterized protein n=1 Tax=Sesamum angolense TaxID=2727404 RepID=A0AAE2BMW3_9LAMI|nr:hypothetical protein Sango_2179100 [Sesamum angolense]
MGNGYDHRYSIHQQQFHQKSKFLPIFCRLSIKDVKLNHHYKDPTTVDEPSSPTVSCVGQVKRNNRVIGFPATSTTTSAAANHHHKHTKLKNLFSGKTLLPNTTTINASTTVTAAGRRSSGSRSCRTSRDMFVNSSRRSRLKTYCDHSGDQDCVKVVDISEMDPPLPVVKRVAPPGAGRDEVNIWKRRFNGVELKSLKIEQIHLPNSKFEAPLTTV